MGWLARWLGLRLVSGSSGPTGLLDRLDYLEDRLSYLEAAQEAQELRERDLTREVVWLKAELVRAKLDLPFRLERQNQLETSKVSKRIDADSSTDPLLFKHR